MALHNKEYIQNDKKMNFRDYIKQDKIMYAFPMSVKAYFRVLILREHEYIIWKYQKLLRREEYYSLKGNTVLSTYFRYRKNLLGERLGFTIPKFTFSTGLRIWHYGNIVVNAHSKIGKNCTLHGDNCIGNNGKDNECPIIGDNVDIGVGAKIIGGVRVADNVTIGAGAVVVHDINVPGAIVVGIPAKIIKV